MRRGGVEWLKLRLKEETVICACIRARVPNRRAHQAALRYVSTTALASSKYHARDYSSTCPKHVNLVGEFPQSLGFAQMLSATYWNLT